MTRKVNNKGKNYTVKDKQADVLATDNPFLVNCSGPSFMIVYVQPLKDDGTFGSPVTDGGGVLNWASEGTVSEPNPSMMNKIPESNATLPN